MSYGYFSLPHSLLEDIAKSELFTKISSQKKRVQLNSELFFIRNARGRRPYIMSKPNISCKRFAHV